jgi:hypothetical protein
MEKQFLHISFIFKEAPNLSLLDAAMNKALDFTRYSETCWIVYTSNDAKRWYKRLKPAIGAKNNVLIVKLDIAERQGYMPSDFWAWLKKPRRSDGE